VRAYLKAGGVTAKSLAAVPELLALPSTSKTKKAHSVGSDRPKTKDGG
jgi:hypothetical protein